MMIACPACNHTNPADNRFCGMCGARLERRRTPDSELLPEDAEHRGPAADIPPAGTAQSPVQQQQALEWNRREPVKPRHADEAAPIGDLRVSEEPRATRPGPSLNSPLTEPPASGTYMGFSLANESQKPAANEGEPGYSVSGPSFLGLGDQPGSSSPEYLLEDEAPRHSAGKWFLGIVVLVGVLAYGQWRANGRGETLFAGLPAIRAPKPVLANKQAAVPAAKTNTDDDEPDMDVAPVNADLKAQTEAVKKANSMDGKTQAADQKATEPADSNAEKQADEQASAAEKSADNSATTDTKAAKSEASDGTGTEDSAGDSEARPEPVKAVTSKPAKHLEKTKVAATKPKPKASDPSAAMLAEGQRYLYGQGVRKSCEQALNLIHGAANEGNAEARSQLGGMYATGNCAPFDRVTAYRWFTLALSASPRNPRVQQTRDMLWREMTDTERQRARNMTESRD